MPATHPASSGHFNSSPTTTQGRVRGGGPATPEATTPKVADPPAAATPPPAPPNPATPASTTQVFAAIADLIAAAVKPNALNKFYQSTYHFRLFMAADDLMTSIDNASNMTDMYQRIDSATQVTLAESGVTGFNIKDVTITSTRAGNTVTRAMSATTFTMTIVEPNGCSFLDGLGQAGKVLKIRNYAKAHWYLELRFLGYDETGNFVGNLNDTFATTGGRWVWAVAMNRIDAKLNEGGGVYTLTMIPSDLDFLLDKYDVIRVPQAFFVTGKTIAELFSDYIKQLNNAWRHKYADSGNLVKFDKIITRPNKTYLHPPNAADQDPGTFNMKSQEAGKNPNRNWAIDSQTGIYTVNVTPGYTVTEFITDAIKHTEQGQRLAIDDGSVRAETDQSPTKTNDRGFRECITWAVEPIVTFDQFDKTTHNYTRNISFYVTPCYSQGPVISKVQKDDANDPAVQRKMIQSHLDNGLLRKRYDYIFTGLNTEVIDFDIAFNLQYQHIVGAYAGSLMKMDAYHVNERFGPTTPSKTSNLVQATPNDTLQVVAHEKVSPTPNAATPVAASSPTNTATRVTAGSPSAQVSLPLDNGYIEDLLSPVDDDNSSISFWQGFKDVKNEAGEEVFPGQTDREQGVLGAIFNQIYGEGGTAFLNVDLTIRGDPYWLGQGNLHRQIVLKTDTTAPSGLDESSGEQAVYITFRYPLTTGNDFKPVLNDSPTFNGVYSVVNITHSFSDGVFKQTFTKMPRCNLIQPSKWNATSATTPVATNGGASSNPQQKMPTTSSTSDTNTQTVGKSPVAGVDYKPGDKASFVAAFTPLAQQQSAATGIAPELILAQSGVETGWGGHAPQNNFFGIKGTGDALPTQEVENGQLVNTTANFQGYQSAADSFNGYSTFINSNPRYAGVAGAGGIAQQAQALQDAHYAGNSTDYASKLTGIANGIHIPTTGSTVGS